MKKTIVLIAVLAQAATVMAGVAADFSDLTLAPETYWRSTAEAAGFDSGLAHFSGTYAYIPEWSYETWDGFAYSNITDNQTAGSGNQFAAITGEDVGGDGNYAIAYDPVPSYNGVSIPSLSLPAVMEIDGAYLTNTAYAYYSMRDGDQFAKQFGGTTGDDADYLLLTITGRHNGAVTGTVDFYLADFRFENNDDDYIVSDWTWVDFSGLGLVDSIDFSISGTDMGRFGLNTPAYFAMDTLVPEPTTMSLLAMAGVAMLRRRR